ncbi:hypothetical protein E2562_022245, partial [Oryza meyeriana var. granulata]
HVIIGVHTSLTEKRRLHEGPACQSQEEDQSLPWCIAGTWQHRGGRQTMMMIDGSTRWRQDSDAVWQRKMATIDGRRTGEVERAPV